MILERLTLCDFGVFSGRNTFELAPRRKYGAIRPIVLFGGLNGSGKTTILTAVRLCLYGKSALASSDSQKVYQDAVRNLIHRNPESVVPVQRAEVALEFTYSKVGATSLYRVVRVWEERGKSIEEHLGIFKDGVEVPGLTPEQGQAFLSQLIPNGVSQFFFFDGEKIASLAQDQSDEVLAQSVHKLLGLDYVQRLRTDLTILIRQKRVDQAGSAKAEYEALEREQRELENDCERIAAFVQDDLNPRIEQAKSSVAAIKANLAERGADWAVDRRSMEQHLEQIQGERRELEASLRDLIGERMPFALSPVLTKNVLTQISKETESAKSKLLSEILKSDLQALETYLSEALSEKDAAAAKRAVKAFLQRNSKERKSVKDIHAALSDSDRAKIGASLEHSLPAAIAEFRRSTQSLAVLEKRIEDLETKLARAPTDDALKETFSGLQAGSEEVGRLLQQKRAHIEEMRRKTWASIDLVRKLRSLEQSILKKDTGDLGFDRAGVVLELMGEFSDALATSKVKTLEKHFVAAFARLARKEDMVVDVRIDPNTFAASLIDRHGKAIPKDRLSAGEKQIYAIAMLEALGKASGRQLPVIIDTPLGRLDSHHRGNLVENYFPRASHQVIVLSTDTEVDEPFYQGMSRHISHAYHLVFDHVTGATKAEAGYFWKERRSEEEGPRAA